ncbi:MAG: alpha/beta hydrolase [PVC group bacterium]|nr:alpha/beta hydrolase [PVC group bacterium]
MGKVKYVIVVFIVCFLFIGCSAKDEPKIFGNTMSKDGVSIAYSVYGQGEVTLVFIHGWSCDSRYWNKQIAYFSKKYKVVTIDLAGHGNSGLGRKTYTMAAFGQDIAAVLQKIDAKNVVLAGHSMGGGVILHAATIAPERIIGLIGVDTLQDMGRRATEEEKRGFYDPLAADFKNNVKNMVRTMFLENADKELIKTVALDMSSAPEAVALSALDEYLKMFDAELVKNIDVPIKCVNADLWSTNVERNKRLVPSYEMALMKGYGHFIMLEAPDEFNELLGKMMIKILNK